MHVRDRRIVLLLPRENDGRRSGVQHTMSREIALQLPSSFLVWLVTGSGDGSGRATWLDLQSGRVGGAILVCCFPCTTRE